MRLISTLRRECLLGKSLLRTLHNLHLSKINKFDGHGIDFGSDGTSSYYRFIKLEKEKMTFVDLYRNLEESNFQDIEITKIGIGGFTVCASLISRILKFKNLVFLSWIISLNLDKLLSKVWKTNKDIYTGISFSAKKLPRKDDF